MLVLLLLENNGGERNKNSSCKRSERISRIVPHTLRLTRDEPDLGALTMTGRVWQEEEQDGRIRGKQAGRVHTDRRLAIFTIWY